MDFLSLANHDPALSRLRDARRQALERPHFAEIRERLSRLQIPAAPAVDVNGPIVSFGAPGDLDPAGQENLRALIRLLMPWRKGPFSVCGELIDAEWRSDRKWDRIREAIPPLAGKRLIDVGCNNGYYLFRASGHGASPNDPPELLAGIDPSEPFSFAFDLFQRFYRHPVITYDLLGIEHLEPVRQQFDVALCLGIVYHQRDPLRALQLLRGTLKPGGVAVVESQTVPGSGSIALFPPERYAKAHNVYFVPTNDCLISWMRRAGFSGVELISDVPVTPEEQRKTPLMQFESLTDYLDPDDPSLTVEGLPAPRRSAVVGRAPTKSDPAPRR